MLNLTCVDPVGIKDRGRCEETEVPNTQLPSGGAESWLQSSNFIRLSQNHLLETI